MGRPGHPTRLSRPGQTTRHRVTRPGHTTRLTPFVLTPRKSPLCFYTKVAAGMLLLLLVGTVQGSSLVYVCPEGHPEVDLESKKCLHCGAALRDEGYVNKMNS